MNMYIFRVAIIVTFMILETISIIKYGVFGGFLPLFIFGLIIIGNPKILLLTFWIWSVFMALASYMIPTNLSIILDFAMIFVLFATYILKRIKFNNIRAVILTTIGLLLLYAISFLVNRPSIVGAGHFAITYFRFLLVFYYSRYFLSPDISKKIYYIIIGTFFIQLILNIGWLLHINPLPNYTLNPADFAIGTFNACNIVAYFSIVLSTILISVILNKNAPSKIKTTAIIILPLVYFQIIITYTIHAYIIALLSTIIISITSRGQKRIKFVLFLLVTILSVIMLFHEKNTSHKIGSLNAYTLKQRWYLMISGTKGNTYKEIILYAPKDMPYPIVGAGPGNFGSAMGIKNRTPLANKYINYVLDANSYLRRKLSQGESITGMAATGFLAIWSELGPFGFLLYWGIHVFALIHIFKNVIKRQYENNLYRKALAESFIPTMIMFLILNLLSDFCTVRVMHAGLWILAAVIWDADNVLDNTSKELTRDN